jgi:hypothetical protein
MLPLVDVRWSGPVLEMRYVPSRSTWHALDALLAAERAECPWLVWELRFDRGWPVVRIHADPQDYPALAAIAFVATGGQGGYPRRPAERTSWAAVESPGERDGVHQVACDADPRLTAPDGRWSRSVPRAYPEGVLQSFIDRIHSTSPKRPLGELLAPLMG